MNLGIPLCHTEWHLALGIMVKADTTDGQNPGWMRNPEQGSPHLCRRPLQPLSGDSWCMRDEPWATESQLFVCLCALIISNSTSPAAIWQITAAIKSVLHRERGTADGLAFVFLLWWCDQRRTGRKMEVWGISSLQGKCHCILVHQAEAETAHPTETLQEGTIWRQSGWFRTMVLNSMILVSPPQTSEHWELSIFGFSSGYVGGSFDISQYSIMYETASEQRTIKWQHRYVEKPWFWKIWADQDLTAPRVVTD